MTKDEIIAMAREAGFYDGREELFWVGPEGLKRFSVLAAEKAAAAEREAIAAHYEAHPHVEFFGRELADAIRARSNHVA